MNFVHGVIPGSVWTPSASGHSGLCWSLLVWSQTLCHRFSDLLGILQKTYIRPVFTFVTVLNTVTQKFTLCTICWAQISTNRIWHAWLTETRPQSKQKNGGGTHTSAGEGHPPIFLLGRGAFIGSRCSDSKGGGSRQGTAVVIQLSTRGHHHAVVVGEQRELYSEKAEQKTDLNVTQRRDIAN